MIKLLTNVTVIILLSSLFVIAQKKQTDRDFDGLKGAVKSVVTERADLKKSSGKMFESKRKQQEAITYDSGGNRLTWKTYDYLTGTLFDSVVYNRVNGQKVAMYEDVKNSNKIVQLIASPNEKSSELSNSRYSQTLKYKYDLEGKITEEAWFQSDGTLWLR